MDSLNIEDIWKSGHRHESSMKSVEETAKGFNGKSVQLVDKIRNTGRNEHYIFLILMGVVIVYLLWVQNYFTLAGIAIFTSLIIWKYEVEMGMLKKIKIQNDTLKYLTLLKQLLDRYMRNYKIGILIGVPILILGRMIIGQYILEKDLSLMLTDKIFWIVFLFSCLLSFCFSRLFLYLWVKTLYGRKFKEMNDMIKDLQAL